VIFPPVTIDGPSSQIVEFGGVAMAPDGTGGLVYTKAIGGVPHVFASRYDGETWSAPIEVDPPNGYEASQARISAGPRGSLEVVWVAPVATVEQKVRYGLWSSSLGPGSESFGRPLLVDANVRGGAGVDPSLAGYGAGKAIVAYRVVTQDFSSSAGAAVQLRPGDVMAEVRLARLSGERWSKIGAVNRNLAASMRAPSLSNAPQVAIGATGNAVVVWPEPEQQGVSRLWVRRVFGTTVGPVFQLSPSTWEGKAISGDISSFSLAVTEYDEARIAMDLPGPVGVGGIYVSTIGSSNSTEGTKPEAATLIAGAAGGSIGPLAPGSVDATGEGGGLGMMRLAFPLGGSIDQLESEGIKPPAAVPGMSGPSPLAGTAAVTAVGAEGSGVLAYPAAEAGVGEGLAVLQGFPNGTEQTATLSGAAAGPVSEVAIGRSGLGDALLGFRQGEAGSYEIVGDRVSAPPSAFRLRAPKRWLRPGQVLLRWIAPASASGSLRYRVMINGRAMSGSLRKPRFHPGAARLGNGIQTVRVLATDRLGGVVLSNARRLRIDGSPPRAALHLRTARGSLSVRFTDSGSGLLAKSTRCRFGDGTSARGGAAFHHDYARPGRYEVTVVARDRVGNRLHASYRIRVR
jgi:hypothetical protein